MKHLRNIFVLFAAVCLITAFAFAGSSGKIAGHVTDVRTNEALLGVTVVVKGSTLGGSTDPDGRYVILNVPPGLHTITASYIGYKKAQVKDVRVSVDFTTTLDFALEEGNIELEPVIVQGERTPLIRADLTNPVASISSEAIEALPVTEISEVIGLQAGITVGDDGVIHIRGGLGNEVAYTLNGININNPYGNTRSVGVATNAVQEVSVSSGTFNAEYGSALSGVVNYVTKDGGQNWSGGLKYYTGDHGSSHTDLFNNIDDRNPANVYRFEATIGGPLIGEALSFYGSGAYNWNGGYLYGQRIYRPEDSYLSREGFPSGDLRRGATSTPFYFGPLRHPTTDSAGGPSGDGSVVALNWSRSYNLQGNLSYHLTPEIKLKYELVYDNDLRPNNDGPNDRTGANSKAFDNRFKPDGRALDNDEGWFHSLEWTHSLGNNIFFTLKGSYIVDKLTIRAYDNIDDPRYLPSFYSRTLPNTDYLTGGVDVSRFYRKTQTIGGKFDLVAQLFNNHEVKVGVEVRSHKLEVESYTLQFKDPDHPNEDPSFTNVLVNGYQFKPFIPTIPGGYINYTRKPLQLATYVQDKIELFRSIILNLGLRYEFFKPAAQYNPALSQELSHQDTIFVQKNLTDASNKHMLAPRFSVSYPITDRGAIRFSYGHFYQIGSLSSLYRNPYFRAPSGTTPSFGNPEVNPQKSIQYELGLQQGLSDNLKIEVTGYYKDVRDYIYSQRIITARGDKQYNVLTNLSYANTRGISISMLKRRSPSDLLSASLDYTFQVAEGNRTEPTDEIFFNEQRGELSETFLVPFSFDRSHTITSTVTLSRPDDWTASMIGFVRTGTPYTPSFPANVVPITFVQNSDRQTVQWNVDIKLEKFFKLGPVDYSVFLQVDNLFDTENEKSVYANSGSALYNIEQTLNPTQFADVRNRILRGDVGMVPLNAIDNYYANPGNISQPRLVRIGASVLF
jgi:outer membrane receptor protein involved in Fe transport